jgi:hypothetical protein
MVQARGFALFSQNIKFMLPGALGTQQFLKPPTLEWEEILHPAVNDLFHCMIIEEISLQLKVRAWLPFSRKWPNMILLSIYCLIQHPKL